MKTVVLITLILASFGCAHFDSERTVDHKRLEAAIAAIQNCSTENEQVRSIKEFYDEIRPLLESGKRKSDSLWLFDAAGKLLRPGQPRQEFAYALFIDSTNKKGMYLPFMVKPLGDRARNAILSRRI